MLIGVDALPHERVHRGREIARLLGVPGSDLRNFKHKIWNSTPKYKFHRVAFENFEGNEQIGTITKEVSRLSQSPLAILAMVFASKGAINMQSAHLRSSEEIQHVRASLLSMTGIFRDDEKPYQCEVQGLLFLSTWTIRLCRRKSFHQYHQTNPDFFLYSLFFQISYLSVNDFQGAFRSDYLKTPFPLLSLLRFLYFYINNPAKPLVMQIRTFLRVLEIYKITNKEINLDDQLILGGEFVEIVDQLLQFDRRDAARDAQKEVEFATFLEKYMQNSVIFNGRFFS